LTVAFDASVIVYTVTPNANPPKDPLTGKRVEHCKERVDYLLKQLQAQDEKIVIPTPSLGEILVKAGEAGPAFIDILKGSKHFRVAPFDERAAVEFAATQVEKKRAGKKSAAPRVKAKFDDQIVAIARVEGATVIYSDDPHIGAIAGPGITVIGIAELPLPPEDKQVKLPFGEGRRAIDIGDPASGA
jgi:predicted nucleic acid-binding protein